MNTHLYSKDNGTSWIKVSMPRVYRSVRGEGREFAGNIRHHLFDIPIAANDPLIGQRVMVRYHVSIHSAGWAESCVVYANLEGPVEGVPNTYDKVGHRFSVPEYTPASTFPNGSSTRRSAFHGMICCTITGSGTITLGFEVDGANWEFRDDGGDSLEQSVAMMYPLGG
jgi:hypothetical protein